MNQLLFFVLTARWSVCVDDLCHEPLSTAGLLGLCLEGRLGLGTQDTHNSPQQVCLPVGFEAQRAVCGVDCSMIISSQSSIMACGSNR